MKKVVLSLWLLMLSITVTAQTFVIVDKSGNRINYDVSKLDSITFQNDPPGFNIYEEKLVTAPPEDEDPSNQGEHKEKEVQTVTNFTFEDVTGFQGDPEFLFVHPDTVYVGGEDESFTFQLRNNILFDYTTSHDWLKFKNYFIDSDSVCFEITKNPDFVSRTGYIVFTGRTESGQCDTLVVIQSGKNDSHYIPIDWESTSLSSFNEQTGEAVLSFSDKVPEMGSYDVVLLPKDDSYTIRLIDNVRQAEDGKTVTLATRQGIMGNLFKGQRFTLATEAGSSNRAASLDGDDAPVILPTKVEFFTGNEYVEVYNADNNASHRLKAPVGFENEFINWEYNKNGEVLWESGLQSLSWDKLNFSIGLKGRFSFDFGDIPFEKVRMGDLKNLKITLDGGFNMEMVLKYLVASEVEWKREWTLKEDAFKAKYTFTVGTIPVYITVGADLMAEVSLGASGEASITSGITASNTVTYGVEWDAEKGLSKIAECEKKLELVGPDVDIKAHAEARATCYPKIEIGIYKVLCPTISPQPYIKAEADGRLVDNKYVAWNAGVSAGIDLGLGLCLDLFFFKKDLGEIDPINVFDLPLVSLPDEIELLNEPEEEVLINGKREVKYHVTNKINLTGSTYNAPGVLVHFTAEGGELEDEYGYTDSKGNVSAFFTLTDRKGGIVKAEVVLGAEGDAEEGEEDEDAIKSDDWNATAIDYRLTATPASQDIEKGSQAAITYKLERYTSKTGEWTGFGGQTVEFEASGGTVAPASAVTSADGIVTVTFTPEEDATEGNVTATTAGSEPDPWSKICAANIKVNKEDEGGIDDVDLKKAEKLKENVYEVKNKRTGEIQTREYVSDWSEWNKDQDVISFTLEDADADGGTQGMVYGFIPLTMTDVVLALTTEQFANTAGMKFGFGLYVDGEVSGNFMTMTDMTEGNIKPDGSSKIILRKVKSASSAAKRVPGEEDYTGEYELLYYIVFKDRSWNQETGEEEEGDEYEIYGRGTMKMHLPTITSFQAQTEKDWVKVGESTKVVLTQYYEESATWDWDDVQLSGQSADYSDARAGVDEGFFSWDASTQTLTSLKSNNNKTVWVCLSLKSKPDVKHNVSVATGDGWKYTMIKANVDEITTNANSYPSFSFDWAPKESDNEKLDYSAFELDPDCNPNGYFQFPTSYANQGWPIHVSYNTPAGEYTLVFRMKSDHNVNCTLKVIVTETE